jgi:hypothetical protein
MKNPNEYVNEITGAGMNRRNMLKALLGGAGAGLMALPLNAQRKSKLAPVSKTAVPHTLSATSAQVLWQQKLLSSYENQIQQAAYGNGYCIFMDISNNVLLTDVQTGALGKNQSGIAFGTFAPWRDGAFVTQTADGQMIVCQNVPASAGGACMFYAPSPSPVTALSNYCVVGNNESIIYLGTNGILYVIDVVWDPASNNFVVNEKWKLVLFTTQMDSAIVTMYGSNKVVVAAGDKLVVADTTFGQPILVYSTSGQGGASAVCVDGNCIYIAGNNGVDAFNIATGVALWKQSFVTAGTVGTPICYGGVLYIGDSTNLLYAVNTADGSRLWPPQAYDSGMHIGTPQISDGILYIGSAAGKIYAIDLAKGAAGAAAAPYFDTQIKGNTLLGMEGGICVVLYGTPGAGSGAGTFVQAINMTGLVHGFSSESELMADNYVAASNSNGYQPDSASYRTIIQLLDGQGNPRSNMSVKVWASDDVSISDGVNTYSLNPPDTAWLKTDASGQLQLSSVASDITSPALYFWAPFMLNQEAIVVYPDHEALARLSSIQASDLDPSVAKDYSGNQIVPDGVDHTAVASTIQNTMGAGAAAAMVATRLVNRQRAEADLMARRRAGTLGAGRPLSIQSANTYMSFPETTENMIYQQVMGAADRALMQGAAQSFTTTIDDKVVTFGPASLAARLRVRSAQTDDWLRFKSWLKTNVTDKITKIVCTIATEITHEITTLASGVFTFVVDTVEKAVAVVTGFVRTLVGDIVRAAQWLSKLFDWGGILSLQKNIVNQVNSGVQGLTAWINAQGTDFGAVNTFLQGKINNLATIQASIVSKLSGSLKSNQVNNNDPQSVYGAGGAKSYAQSSSMSSKVSNNIGQATPASSTGATSTVDNPNLSSALSTLLSQGETLLSTILTQLIDSIKAFFDGFKLMFSDPAAFIETEVADLVNLLFDLAEDLLGAIKILVGFVLRTLASVINDVLSLVNEPVHIPVISDLWSLISHGEPLTVLNVFALMIAIPSHIILSAANIASPASVSAKPRRALGISGNAAGWLAVTSAVASFFSGGIDGFCDLENENSNSFASKLDLAGALIVMALELPGTIGTNSDPSYVYFALGAFPILLGAIQAGTFNASQVATSAAGKLSNFFGPMALSLYGVAMIILSIGLAVDNPTQWDGNGHVTLIGNIFSGLDYVPKGLLSNPAKCFPDGNELLAGGATEEVRLGVAMTDWIFPTASGICNAASVIG